VKAIAEYIANNYYIEFEFTVGTQTVKVQASLKRVGT
jgi:hypothetical protein